MRTGQQIEDDVYGLVAESSLSAAISGEVYKFGMRPRDSLAEDAVVKFVTGLADQIQTGVVVVNIFIADLAPWENGVMVRDITRCNELEIAAAQWVKSLAAGKSDYKFRLAQTIYTVEEPDIKQHFVSVRLNYKLLTN